MSAISSQSLQGRSLDCTTPEQRTAAIDAAVDYRGDVTVHLKDGRVIEAFLFNHAQNLVSYYAKGVDAVQTFSAESVSQIVFSGRDTADGKSYENWKAKKASQRQAEAAAIAQEMREQGYL